MTSTNFSTELLSLPSKQADDLDYYKPLKEFIGKRYGAQVAKEYENSLTTLQQHRRELRNLQEKSESARDFCYKFALELSYVDKHFPINTGAERIHLAFAWYDAFSRRKVSQGNIFYEQASVLFNAAALESQSATAENRTSAEGITTAAKRFQAAAGILAYIKDRVLANVVERITNDLTAESLEFLILLMLANAQQCVVEKSIKQSMKPANVAILAAGCANIYNNAYKLIDGSAVLKNEQLSRDWVGHIKFKSLFFDAVAQYFMSVGLHADMEIGTEIARIKRAQYLMNEAANCRISSALKGSAKDFMDELNRAYNVAESENQKIYHMRIPDFGTLDVVERRELVKPTPIESLNALVKLFDPFEKLYPVHVMEAKQKYLEQLNNKVNNAVRGARVHREALKQQLSSMGLPGSILAAEKKQGFPEEIHNKISKIVSSGGMERVNEMKNALLEMSTSTRQSCAALKKLLDEEQEDDRQCREQYGQRWRRMPSEPQTANLRKVLFDYDSKVEKAQKADELINSKLQQNDARFRRFGLSRMDLDRLMPNPDLSDKTDQLGKAFNDLRELLAALDSMFGKEEAIQTAMKAMQEEEGVELRLLEAQDSVESAVASELTKVDAKVKELTDLQPQEDSIMQRIVQANTVFVQVRGSSVVVQEREKVIQDMMVGINKYDEIMSNIREGINFYSTMQDLTKKLQQKVEDFVFARKTEKADLLAEIQSAATSMPVQFTYAPPMQPQQPLRPGMAVQNPIYNSPQLPPPQYNQPSSTWGAPQPGPQFNQYGQPTWGAPQPQPGYPPQYSTYGQQQPQQPPKKK